MRAPLLAYSVLTLLHLHAQEERSVLTHDDRTLLRSMYEHCPKADILQIDRSESNYVELEYLCDGKIVEMGIKAGEVVFIERETDPAEVPEEQILRLIEKHHPGGFIDEVSMLTVKDSSFFKVELIQDGIEHNMFVTTTGKIYKPRTSLASEKWNLSKLEELAVRGPRGYDLLAPDTTYQLPPILREISGIATRDGRILYAVQDELGVVFEYDLAAGNISKIHRFTDVGDFEDITLMGDRILVLRSDGNIFKIGGNGRVEATLVQLPTLNVEGLHFDTKSGRLLLASKEAGIAEAAHLRTIYEVDEEGRARPYLVIDVAELGREFNKRHPSLHADELLLDPSAIAVHPSTGELYVLSAADRLIAVYGNGLKDLFPLPAELFYKPEGLQFLSDGTLLISSEGDKKGFTPPSVMLFEHRK